MSCLSLSIGEFRDSQWLNSSLAFTNDNSIRIENLDSGDLVLSRTSNPSQKIIFHPQNSVFKFTSFGSRYLFVVELFNFMSLESFFVQKLYGINTTEGHQLSRSLLFDSNNEKLSLPFVGHSLGAGDVAHIYSQRQDQYAYNLAFRRSDTGLVIYPVPPKELQLNGGLRVRGSFDGQLLKMIAYRPIAGLPAPVALPLGRSRVSVVQPFPDALVGSGTPPDRRFSMGQFRITNTGSNCLTLTGISNSPHFIVKNPVQAPVVLDPGQKHDVFIKFDPAGHSGNYNEQLPIHFGGAVETGSDLFISCHAKAKALLVVPPNTH